MSFEPEQCKYCGGQGWYSTWANNGDPPEQIQCGPCYGTGYIEYLEQAQPEQTNTMKIKDLPLGQSLQGVRFRYPGDGQLYYWASQWSKGVWGKKRPEDTQVHPLACDNIQDALNWEVVP
jgi:hypothetical protein